MYPEHVSPESITAKGTKSPIWVLTYSGKSATLKKDKVVSTKVTLRGSVPTYLVSPLHPYKKRSEIYGRRRGFRPKNELLVFDTRRALGRYPFLVRCEGGCRFHKTPAVCFPFKRLCWDMVKKRPFSSARQALLQNGVHILRI
jgi:hypothetical protein